MMKLCHIGELNALFTDDYPPPELLPMLQEHNVRVYVPGQTLETLDDED